MLFVRLLGLEYGYLALYVLQSVASSLLVLAGVDWPSVGPMLFVARECDEVGVYGARLADRTAGLDGWAREPQCDTFCGGEAPPHARPKREAHSHAEQLAVASLG